MVGAVVCGDVIVEILAKLPVKSLLRFICVCKTWYSVISYHQFSNSLHRLRPSVLICENRRDFSTITIESLLTIKDKALTPLSFPWEAEAGDCFSENICLGSCNGLVCVDHRSSSSLDRSSLIIWNPSTRKFKRLPRPRGYSVSSWTYAWFGYDELIDDYKLVWLNVSEVFRELDVFTLKSNVWRMLPVDNIAVIGLNLLGSRVSISTGVLSNRAIHWITAGPFLNEAWILVLDLATETLRVLELTHAQLSPVSRTLRLEGGLEGRGCLCLCTDAYTYEDILLMARDLWMMEEYDSESSWTKRLSIPVRFDHNGCPSIMVCPILFSNEGKERVFICNMKMGDDQGRIVKLRVEEGGKKVKNEEILLCLPRNPFRSNIILHMEESLVSISYVSIGIMP